MGDFTYSDDYRDRDGLVCDAEALRRNLSNIEDISSGLGWRSIQPESLDQFHIAEGEPLKQIEGGHYIDNQYLEPWTEGGGAWKTVALYRFKVRSGSGVYCVASATYASSARLNSLAGVDHGTAHGARDGHGIKFIGTGGEYHQRGASNPENCGQVGGVWAYQAQDHHPEVHELRVVYTSPVEMSAGIGVMTPLRTNIAVFVVDR